MTKSEGVPDARAALAQQSVLNMVREMVKSAEHMTDEQDIGTASFIGLCSVYRAAVHLVNVSPYEAEVHFMKYNLLRFGERWAMGSMYLHPRGTCVYLPNRLQKPILASLSSLYSHLSANEEFHTVQWFCFYMWTYN
jgi:hypothetical protein